MNWISVDERLPEFGINVVVWDSLSLWHDGFLAKDGWMLEAGELPVASPVTHWLEITPPQTLDEQRAIRAAEVMG